MTTLVLAVFKKSRVKWGKNEKNEHKRRKIEWDRVRESGSKYLLYNGAIYGLVNQEL